VTASSQEVMLVYPEIAEFESVEADVEYSMLVRVQNKSKYRRAVRVVAPSSKCFSIDTAAPRGSTLALGMTMTIKVKFACTAAQLDEEEALHDALFIVFGNERHERIRVPLHAYPPIPSITFNGDVDLGQSVVNNTVTQYVEFRNEGSREGAFRINFPPDVPLTAHPAKATLAPRGEEGSILLVRLQFAAQTLGALTTVGQVDVGPYAPPALLQVK
jgi:hypothetical protein